MIISFKEALQDAYRNKYAVGAFNCLSLENVMGAIQAAEELRSPIILQLAEVQFPYSPIALMAPIFIESAKKATVPVAVHLDHGQSFETCAKAIRLGFNSVMIDGSGLPLEENIRVSSAVVRMAKAFDVDVEAELGKVGDTGSGEGEGTGNASTADVFTDVEESARFIRQTGIDALAIAIGNLHGKYIATPRLNIQRLIEIKDRNNIPLVLHGGSGTSEEDFKACIHNGISKINVATAIQLGIAEEMQAYLGTISKPSYIEMKYKMVEATKQVVMKHILLFESNNRV
ncbi:class II fructose-bisphosphate aldolase [Parabacteroides sp. Marseille-P3160]|uniref:class II fructose-bisphosphate aldolase n=1 Tax=Parabacteroides sp. Marseille-P3160 TaxID=1917887 RepID=UPI0009BB1050|nr:class II fructose-bisphosphate aldolase [Parabacteroides sp. Marseille-P3160]